MGGEEVGGEEVDMIMTRMMFPLEWVVEEEIMVVSASLSSPTCSCNNYYKLYM